LNTAITYKHLTALFFLAAFLAQTFNRAFVIADYYTNTTKYAKNCENKEKPQLKCHGKCQMTKKLQEQDKQDEENPERKAENKSEVLLSSISFFAALTIPSLKLVSTKKLNAYPNGKPIDRHVEVFHPPQYS
jgi:hypothetical protein